MSKNPFKRNNRWVEYVELPKDPITNKRRRKWIYGDKEDAVKRQINALRAMIDKNNYTEPVRITLEEYFKKWIKIYCASLSPVTVQGYNNHINNHIVPALGKMYLGNIKPMHIQEFYDKQHANKINVRQQHAILRKALGDAVKNEYLSKNPCLYVKVPLPEEFKPTVYTKEDFNKLLRCVKGTRDELVIVLAGLCGLRRGEIMGLQWKDIDLKNNTISIRQSVIMVDGKPVTKEPKTRSSIRSFIFPSLLNEIFKRHQKFGNCFVLSRKDGSPEIGGNYSHHFKYILEKNKLKPTRLHDLRHFTATMLLENGVDVKIVSSLLGHSSTNITQKTYQHVTANMQQVTADKLNTIII